ncbi:MAG: UbiA family prenyltransferase [Oscillochloridaceae bacterium umkhey_bin13]
MAIPQQPVSLSLRILGTSRFYSVPYLTAASLGILLATTPTPSARSLLVVLALPACFAVGVAAWNDLAHRKADQRSGRRASDQQLLIRLGTSGSLAALGLALLGGLGTLLGVSASLLSGVGYAFSKSLPLVANLVRGLTTLTLLLGFATLEGQIEAALPLALGFALLDSAGNIWGDVRDVTVDQRAGTHTIATRSPLGTIVAAYLLHGVAVVLLAQASPWLWTSYVLSFGLLFVPNYAKHERFLQLKYLTTVLLGLSFANHLLSSLLVLFLGGLVVPATMLYRKLHLAPTT